MARDLSANRREVMIILDEDVITLYPQSGSAADYFTVNGAKHRVSSDSTAHYENEEGVTIVRADMLPSGAMRVVTPENGFEFVYDGLRLKIQTPNSYRGEIRGLCGNFDGEKATDFTSPKNCILKNPAEFTSAYAVTDESCHEPAIKELRQRASMAQCYKKEVIYGDVIKNEESVGGGTDRSMMYTSNKINKATGQTCGMYRPLIIHRAGMKCFSSKPQLTCVGSCTKPVTRVPKIIEFSCVPIRGNYHGIVNTLPSDLSNSVNITESVWLPLQCDV